MFSSNLSNLPGPALDLVLKCLSLDDIQNLRKVCNYLRLHIDSSQLDVKLKSVEVRIVQHTFILMVLTFHEKVHMVKYEQKEQRCLVSYMEFDDMFFWDTRTKLFENEDFGAILGNDLGLILCHQNSILNNFSLEISSFGKVHQLELPDLSVERSPYKCLPRFLTALEPHLKLRKKLLKSRNIVMKDTNQQDEVMKVLPYLDPIYLEQIELASGKFSERSLLKMDRILKLKHWKKVKEVNIDNLTVSIPLRNFHHFIGTGRTRFGIHSISTEELILLREKILQCPTFEFFYFNYTILSDQEKFLKLFGMPYDETNYWKMEWYYKLANTEKAVRVLWCPEDRLFKFYALEMHRVPEDAIGLI